MENIRRMLEDLNGELKGVKRRTKSNFELKRYIPEYKIEKLKEEYVMKSKLFIENILKDIEAKQIIFNEKELEDRKIYAEKQIKKIEERLKGYDEERILKTKDLISKIEYLKSYKIKPLEEIKDFLKKKIKFEYTAPTDREIESLRRLKRFILQKR